MARNGSIAPKERVNITFKPSTGDTTEQVELPMKTMVLGDFTQQPDDRQLEDRKPIDVNQNNFNEVLASQNLKVDFNVANKLVEDAEEDLPVSLEFKSMKDFDPGSIVETVPELKKLMQLREALVSLKGPLGNTPAFRKAIEEVLADDEAREKVLSELNLGSEQPE